VTDEAPVEPAMAGPAIVAIGAFTVVELRVVNQRRQLAAELRQRAREALDAAEHLEDSINEYALIAYAKRGLRDVVGFDDDGNILGRVQEGTEVP
jgi:hypothetical protein